MNRFAPYATALVLISGVPALAAPATSGPDLQIAQNDGPPGAQNPPPRAQDRRPQAQQRPQAAQERQRVRQPGPQAQTVPPGRGPARAAPPPQRREEQNRFRETRRYDWGTYRPGFEPPLWNQYRRNFNMRPYQENVRAPHRYQWRPYVAPPGFYYRHFVFGEIFPRLFWAPQFWITNYWTFGLINPPYGYVWVRYGDDALLVNVQTGVILRVEYGVFY